MAVLAKILRKIVRNDTIKNDPDEFYGWHILAPVFAACFGGMVFGWDTGAIGGVLAMDATKKKFGYFGWSGGAVSTMEQNIVSTLQAGCFAACLFTGWLTDRYGRRWCLMGTAFYQLFNVTGIMLSYWTNYGSLLHISAPAVYVFPLALQSLPAIPRWCATKDDWERATSILSQLRGLPADSEYVRSEIEDMAEQLDHERRLTGDATARALFREMVKIPGNRKRALISIMLMICQQMTGVNAINYYAPQIFENLGMSGTDSGLFATGVYGVVNLFQFGWGPACWILVAEIPTARLRALNVSLAAATQWLFNFIVARTVLTMQRTMGKAGYGMFFMFGSFDLLMFIFVFFFIPETKGLSLEKMDELFGVVDSNRVIEDTESRPTSIREDGRKDS
ncbi:hypothetical protein ACO1O0_009229 [Amphichorda felina]